MSAEIEITIAPDGSIVTKVKGGHGRTCRDVTKAIRDAIGATVEDRTLPEYYEAVREGSTVKQGGRS